MSLRMVIGGVAQTQSVFLLVCCCPMAGASAGLADEGVRPSTESGTRPQGVDSSFTDHHYYYYSWRLPELLLSCPSLTCLRRGRVLSGSRNAPFMIVKQRTAFSTRDFCATSASRSMGSHSSFP